MVRKGLEVQTFLKEHPQQKLYLYIYTKSNPVTYFFWSVEVFKTYEVNNFQQSIFKSHIGKFHKKIILIYHRIVLKKNYKNICFKNKVEKKNNHKYYIKQII